MNNAQSVQLLVKNVLCGNGITASNITYNGDSIARGYFNGTASNIGLDSGLIMTTGSIFNAPGPNDTSNATKQLGLPGDPDLGMISGQMTNDASVIQFDFVPYSDSIRIQYVFASEEYPKFTADMPPVSYLFNDAFGIFLSGPGISGAFSNNAKDIAYIPDTNAFIPITVKDINNGTTNNGPCYNCAYYIDNGTGNPGDTLNGPTVQYNGFTTVLTARAAVQCGATYHIKFAIADGGDSANDSGVFIKAWSLATDAVQVTSQVSYAPGDSVLYEGCGYANIIFTRTNSDINAADTVYFNVGGTATNGVDYTQLPDSIVFPPGVTTDTLSINAFTDTLTEGLESILINIIQPGVCSSGVQSTAIYINDSFIASAGPDQTICSLSTTFAANLPASTTGVWSLLSGSGTVTNPSNPTSTVTGLSPGTNQFVWSVSNGNCTYSKDTVNIFVNQPPSTANAGSDQTICASTTTLNGNTPTAGAGAWSVASGTGNISNYNSPNATVTGLSTGQNTFVWTISNNNCPPSRDTVIITVSPSPSPANAGPDQSICGSAVSLSANTPATGTGSWSVVSGNGTISNPTSANTSVTNMTTGQNQFVWTVSNGSCPSSRDTVNITVNPPPSTADAGSDQTICSDTVTLAGNTPASGTGIWTVLSGSGNITNNTSPATQATGLTVGQNQFIWTISNGNCPPSKDTMTVTVDQHPTTANAGLDTALCKTSSITLNGNNPGIGTGVWSVVSGSGNFSNSNQYNTMVSGLQTGANIFRWTISNGVCPNSYDDVSVQLYDSPSTANAGPDQTIFSTVTNMQASQPTTGTGHWSVVSGAGVFSNSGDPGSQVSQLNFGTNTFRWTVTNGPCDSSYDDVIIVVNQLVIPNAFSPNNDGKNDYFEIKNIETFSNVKLTVFNRWGNMVYQNDNYQNTWKGDNMQGQPLAEDTYYYILDIPQVKIYKGYVIIKRK